MWNCLWKVTTFHFFSDANTLCSCRIQCTVLAYYTLSINAKTVNWWIKPVYVEIPQLYKELIAYMSNISQGYFGIDGVWFLGQMSVPHWWFQNFERHWPWLCDCRPLGEKTTFTFLHLTHYCPHLCLPHDLYGPSPIKIFRDFRSSCCYILIIGRQLHFLLEP